MGYLKEFCFSLLLNMALITAELQQKSDSNRILHRSKRSILQFAAMIKCTTGRSGFAYNGYGCWCGIGGSGIPVDGTDWCCHSHDLCYDNIKKAGTCRNQWDVYTKMYKRSGCNGCSTENTACQKAICLCDSTAAKCFKNNPYNSKYAHYDKKRCSRRRLDPFLYSRPSGM